MTIRRGDYVRPNNPSLVLPQGSVWYVACAGGGPLKLEPENCIARSVAMRVRGFRWAVMDFDKVELCNGQWVAAKDADLLREPFDPFLAFAMSTFERSQNFQNRPKAQTSAVANAEDDLANAASATAALDGMREAIRKLEAQREAELQAAKVAKAKADKEAAAKAKVEEAKRQLSARLHADRCLGEATLALIGEVSRLNNGGSEQVAHSSIAAHVDQLQPLAKSYGYRIAKPSLLAQVVKL